MYNATDYATNFYDCPTVAYSGEIDLQKQAADVMEKALARRGHATHPRHRARDSAPLTIRIRDRDQPAN